MERDRGWYWIKKFAAGRWSIAFYEGGAAPWMLIGTDRYFEEEDIEFVGPMLLDPDGNNPE